MAEHKKINEAKKGDVDQGHRTIRQDSQPLVDKSFAWDAGPLSFTNTSINPKIDEHSKILLRIPLSAQRHEFIMRLHQTYGNRYVHRLVESVRVQAKLVVSNPNDVYEQEADRVADAVAKTVTPQVQHQTEEDKQKELQGKLQRLPEEEEEELQGKLQRQATEEEELQAKPILQRQNIPEEEELQGKLQLQPEEEEEVLQAKSVLQRQVGSEEEELQAKPVDSPRRQLTKGLQEVTPEIEGKISAARGNGAPLDDNIREPMEPAFGADFSGVRIHRGSNADALSRSLQARAFTTGKDIFFRNGEYDPVTSSGQKLIAHELAHTIQQGASSRISRVTGRIIEKTNLRKPHKKNQDKPDLFKFLKPVLNPKEGVELLDKKYPPGSPDWQLAKVPGTTLEGYVRLTKVFVPGATLPTTVKQDLKPKSKTDIKSVVEELTAIISGSGGTKGQAEEARKKIVEAYVQDLFERDRDRFNQLVNICGPAVSLDEESKDKAMRGWVNQNPDFVKVTSGITLGGLGVGAFGDVLSGFTSLWEMGQGLAEMKKQGWKKVRGSLTIVKGAGGALGSLVGLGQKGTSAVSTVIGEQGPLQKLGSDFFSTVSEGFGVLGGILKTLKAPVDIVYLFLKGIGSLYERSKKQVKTTPSEVFDWFVELAKAAWGGVSGAFDAVKSVYNGINTWWKAIADVAKSLIGPIFGIVGAVIQLVTVAIDSIKLAKNIITTIVEGGKKQKDVTKVENAAHKSTEKELPQTVTGLVGPAKVSPQGAKSHQELKRSKSGKPSVLHLRDILKQYEGKKGKTKATDKLYKTVQAYLVDRTLISNLNKSLKLAWSRIGDWIFDGLAIINSVVGALATITLEIVSMVLTPTGIGFAIAQAAKVVSGIVSGAIGVIISVVKGVYTLSRWAMPRIKQLGRDIGAKWFGKKDLKTTKWKSEARANDTIAIMEMIADLKDYKPLDPESRGVYERVVLRLKAAGVDLKEFLAQKGRPEEQAKIIYKALGKTE